MPKEFSKLIKACEVISKYAIYVLVALVPVLVLPFTSESLEFNKQAVLVLLVFVSLFAYMVKILVSGKFAITISKTHIAVAVLMLAYVLATIFSQDRYGSFWGWPRVTFDSLLTIIGLCLMYFTVSNIFTKKEIFTSLVIFALSSLTATLYGVLQLAGLFVIPLGFAKSTAFNTIGSVGNFGMMLAVLLPLLVVFLITVSEKWLKIILGVGVALSAVALFLINSILVWWVILVSSALVIAFGMFKRDLFDLRWLSIPIFFFVLALFFILVTPNISWIPARPLEIYLNQKTTIDVVLKTLKQKPILGSGPGTFSFDFSKFKNPEFNNSQLWNISFDSGASKILTALATTGVVGFLSWILLVGVIIFYGVKFLLKNKDKENSSFQIIIAGVFVALLSQSVSLLLYSSNFVLDFMFLFLIACFISFVSEKKEFNLTPSSFLTLGVTLAFTLVFIFGLGLIILEGQRYIADVNFVNAMSAYNKNQPDKGLSRLESAVSQNPNSDLYWVNLSQAYLGKLSQLASKKSLSDAEKSTVSILANNAANSARNATNASPANATVWANGGMVYYNLIGLLAGAEDWSAKYYDQASALDPVNPYYITQKGVALLAKASVTDKDNADAKKKDLENAKAQFDNAIKLKSDYASARFQLAMVLQAQGKTDQVLPALQETQKYAPRDVGLAFQIGLLYYQNKDYKNAQAEFELATTVNPQYSNALYFLALTYSAQNQNDKAITTITQVLKLNPDNAEIKTVLSNLQAGKDPLAGIAQQTPAQPPVKEETPDKPKK